MRVQSGATLTIRSTRGRHQVDVLWVDEPGGLVYLRFQDPKDHARFHDDFRVPQQMFRTVTLEALHACILTP